MLKVRVIPTLLWKDVGLVKGKSFDSWRRVGTVLPSIRVYNQREVDELILVDVMASETNSEIDYLELDSFSGDCFVPLTVGGGIVSNQQIEKILRCGADKVSINSHAYERPEIISEASSRFGSQCVVASVDCREMDGRHVCFSHRGQRRQAVDFADWIKRLQDLGAGELLLTSIDRDGTMQGYDLKLIETAAQSVSIPVIASGGAGSYQHMHQAVNAGASAVAAASIFHYTEQTPLEAKKYLASKGIPVRNRHQS